MGTGGHQGPCETLGAQVLATLTAGLLKRDVGPSSGLVPMCVEVPALGVTLLESILCTWKRRDL